mgnify:FL=1
MADNLTLKLQQELAKRGKAVDTNTIQRILDRNNISPQSSNQQPSQPQSNMWDNANNQSLPDWFDTETESKADSSVANALGVGLWSFTDTALFGIPGLFVDEEEYLDFEDPLAKWLGAGGTFVGFATGAPLKAGMKIATGAAGKLAPSLIGKAGVGTVTKAMKEAGKASGLSNKAVKEATQGYKKLVQKAQIDETLQGEKFGQAVLKYRDEYIEAGMNSGIIRNADEAAAIRKMFEIENIPGGFNVLNRPIQDLQGIALQMYGNTKKGRFIGHAANDIIAFSMIDAIFEGVTTIEDHEYDWTAPLWGAANGIAFSSLGLLNPKGKASTWFKDFKVGIKSAFSGKTNYQKLDNELLASMSRFMGKSLQRNGKTTSVEHQYKGKTETVNLLTMGDSVGAELGSSRTLAEFERVFGKDNARGAMISFLEGQRKRWGTEIMKWSTKEAASSLMEVWPRMVAGGVLFNSHSFYEMYANNQELDFANDILPNFLIGAYIQRRTNPRKFDLNDKQMIKVRENLALLGFKPDQLSEIPSLMQPESRFRNPMYSDKYRKVIEVAESEGIISDDYSVIDTPLPENKSSIGTIENKNASFEKIYGWLRGVRAYQKPIDGISKESAKKIVDEFNKTNPDVDLNSINSVEKMLDTESLRMTEEFEQNFPNIVGSLKNIDELNIILDDGDLKQSKLKVPQHIMVDSELIKQARDGKIDWLEADGQEAVDKLIRAFDGLNSIVYISDELGQIKINESPDQNNVTIRNIDNAKKIYDRITSEEMNIDNMFPDKSSMSSRFGFADNFNDYRFVVLRNHAIRTAKGITDIFKPEFDERATLITHMKDAGLITFEDGIQSPSLIQSVDQIRIKESGDLEKDAERKRFLGRVLSIQSITGKYNRTISNVQVDGAKIDILRNKLSDYGYNEYSMPMWMHKHIVDFAIRDKIEGTKLQITDVDSIMSLSSLGMANVGVDVTGKKASGFILKLMDEKVLNEGSELVSGVNESDIKEYNRRAREISEKSDGLVTIDENNPVLITDMDMLKIMSDYMKPETFGSSADSGVSAQSTLMEFITLLGTSDVPGSAKMQDQLGKFIEDRGTEGQALALRWVNELGLISLKEGERKFEIQLKNFNDNIVYKLQRKIYRYGVTPEYAERTYERLEKNSRDRQMLDSGEGDYVKTITMQEFFNKYRIDGNKETPANEQEQVINNLIFDKFEGRDITKPESLNEVFNRIYVPNIGKTGHIKFTDLPINRQNKMKPSMLKDFIGLVGGRLGQRKIETLEWKNGQFVKNKEVKQTTRMDLFFDDLGIEPINIDPYVTTYLLSKDGRRVERKRINIFGRTPNLNKQNLEIIENLRDDFNANLGIARYIGESPIVGMNGEIGMAAMRLAPNTSPIAIKNSDLPLIKEKFDSFAELYLAEESPLNQTVKNRIKDIRQSLDDASKNNKLANENDYIAALRRLMLKDMFVGSDGDGLFVDFLNGNVGIDKLFGRTKLYDTKKFVKYDSEFILDVADSYQSIGDKETSKILRERLRKNNFGVVVWNDKANANVRDEVQRYIDDNNIDFDLDSILGDSHMDVSSFDSIAYVNKNTMRFYHTMMGHESDSLNPIKPVISSGGDNSPLLMGKTLFVYAKELDGFFKKKENKNVDIILSSSGAKALNPIKGTDGTDNTLMNDVAWDGINKYKINTKQLRTLTLDSIGVKPEKDVIMTTGKISPADMNYANNQESSDYYQDNIAIPLEKAIRNAQQQIKNPVSTRQWILNQFGDDSLIGMVDGKESLNNLNGMSFFAGLSRDANPLSYSESIVKNKIYGSYIDPLINNRRSVVNQFTQDGADLNDSDRRWGGQASLIQAPIAYSHSKSRLKPTLIDADNVQKSRGEVVLPAYEANQKIATLLTKGYQIKVVDNTRMYDVKDIVDELDGKGSWDKSLNVDITLGNLHELIETIGKENNRPDLQVGIIVRRNPRTRPNDLSLMGLKGFLGKEYGNSMMVNSLDVVNVFEGDYDADKADYFFAERKNMYDHIQRTSQYWVQGIDPSKFMRDSEFSFALNSTQENDAVEEMAANLDLYKSSIGLVQKVPRMLNYLGNLGQSVPVDAKGIAIESSMRGEENSKILYEGPGYKIVMDYDNKDFYQRSALETQYIIDGKGNLNKDIADDIYSWRNDFLFPDWDTSKSAKDISQMDSSTKIGFHNDISRTGQSGKGGRVRIFRKLTLTEDGYKEIDSVSSLDQSIIKEMLSEYGKLLGVTGNTAYEKSGEQRKVSYDDIMESSNRFFKFNQNLRKSLYYRLRNKYQDLTRDNEGNIINKDKWKESKEFKTIFGVKDKTSDDGKFTWQITDNEKMFNNVITEHSKQFATGKRGSPVERTLYQLVDANLFGETRVETLTGEPKEFLNNWYDEFVFDSRMDDREMTNSIGILKSNVLKTAADVNKKIDLIKALNQKIMKIKFNKSRTWSQRKASIEKINNLKKEIEKEIGKEWLGKKYLKTMSSKDLEKIEFVDVNTGNMKKGTVYYATLEQIKRFMPLINGDDGWGLNSSALDDIKNISAVRKLFYGSQDKLGEIYKYGGKTLLTPEQQRLLEQFPDMNTYFDIETQMLMNGVKKHGLKFLWGFMQPTINKRKIGVFEGNPIAVPFEAKEGYDPSSRYRRGINFLTQLATRDTIGVGELNNYELQGLAKTALSYLQVTEAQFQRFFDRRFDMKKLVSENFGEAFAFGDRAQMKLVYDSIKLPNFHKDFEKRFGDFGTIQWTKTGDRIKNGFGLFNDHLFSFYRDIMQAAGKEKEYDNYLSEMSTLQDLMMSNNVINPLSYIHARNTMDRDVRDIAERTLGLALKKGDLTPELTSKLMANPVYALMGGSDFFKNLNLERSSKVGTDNLKQMYKRSKAIENVKNKLPISEEGEERLRRLKDDLIKIKECSI